MCVCPHPHTHSYLTFHMHRRQYAHWFTKCSYWHTHFQSPFHCSYCSVTLFFLLMSTLSLSLPPSQRHTHTHTEVQWLVSPWWPHTLTTQRVHGGSVWLSINLLLTEGPVRSKYTKRVLLGHQRLRDLCCTVNNASGFYGFLLMFMMAALRRQLYESTERKPMIDHYCSKETQGEKN